MTDTLPPILGDARRLAEIALEEDGAEDVTTLVTVAPGVSATGVFEFRTGGVIAGLAYADAVAEACGIAPPVWVAPESAALTPGAVLGEMRGPLSALLRAERPMLNLLQRAIGIATATRAYVDAVRSTGCRILHTRKTAPGLRGLDIRAVLAGGGTLHRSGLATTVMIKDNHWRALEAAGRNLRQAIADARARGVSSVQVEVESLEQLERACAAGATRLLVDNQTVETVRAWAARARVLSPTIEVEATGGITLEHVRGYAEAGVDFVSIGALTHSVRAGDVALEIVGG